MMDNITKRLLVSALAGAMLGSRVVAQASGLTVQAVDPGWFSLPGLSIELTPVSTCTTAGKSVGPVVTKRTDSNGFAVFDVPNDHAYRIQIKYPGFKGKRVCMKMGRSTPPAMAWIQVRMALAGPVITVN